jgi:hypothetical protein
MKFQSARTAKTRTVAMAILFLIGGASYRQEVAAQLKPEKARDAKLERSQANKAQQTPKVQKLPDLVVTNISYSGDKATISVYNRGAAASKPCLLRFELPGIEGWTVDVPGLLPKGFVHTATIGRGQPFVGKGVARVDFKNQIVESNETNNEMSVNKQATAPDLAAVQIKFREEVGISKIVGVVQNVGKVGFINFKGKARLTRIAKYGAHQNILMLKEVVLPNLSPGAMYEVTATMPKPFPGADYYLWILVVNADDANPANDEIEKKSVKFDNNN